jgi:GAF domain-containing protein
VTAGLNDRQTALENENTELRRQLDLCRAELEETRAQQTATAEVLQVINSSPGNLAPVFDLMLEKATRLCEASLGTLWAYDGERMHPLAMRGVSREYAQYLSHEPLRPGAGALGSFVRGETILHVVDLKNTEAYRNGDTHRRALVDLGGGRSLLGVPLRTEHQLRGAFLIYRREPQPFTDKQIALLQNFAAQAVIAMENARLLTETREALEQQTATAEVLQVINASPGDLAPVFEAIVKKAHALCDASFGALMTYDKERFHPVASQGVSAAFKEFIGHGILPKPGDPFDCMVAGAPLSHIRDLSEVVAQYPDDPLARAAVDLGGIRSFLAVPLRKDDALLGVITAYRQEVRPFSDKQITLLQNFAAQAVVAMENARLITETREALEYQTAISDVLRVISGSAFDLTPVLETVVRTAVRLCRADQAVIYRNVDGEYRWAAGCSLAPEYERIERAIRIRPGIGTLVGRAALEGRTVQIIDCWTDPLYEAKEDARVGDIHTLLGVPLLRDGAPIGVIGLARRRVEAFTEKEVGLVSTFADQAVIAIENARLLSETREALEQQTATAEVLQVINSSPGDLAPVFNAKLEKAHTLCGAAHGHLTIYDGEQFRAVAAHGMPEQFAELVRQPFRPGHDLAQRLVGGEPIFHIPDMAALTLRPDDRIGHAAVELGGARTLLAVPLRKDHALLGYITAHRQEVRPFSDKEIALLQNFAAQAVIAMDNARLLGEIRQRQAELRLTFDNMGDGVAMFDAELRLAAWNRNFQEILDLPDTFLAERPRFAEYFGYLAERGEFRSGDLEAELSRKIEDTGGELRLERTRPDGRVIEVRRNPAPGGGFVLIYSDITERKRGEEEIRAARDAAELALRELQTAQASLIHAQKMAALGQLTAGIAHEIKNPLNFVNNFAGLSIELLDELKETAAPGLAALGDEPRAEAEEVIALLTGNLEKIAEHGRRADGIVKSMLDHSRGGGSERRRVDINALIEEALNLAYHGARAQDPNFNVALDCDLERDIAPLEVAPQELTRVFLNLFGNGFYAANQRRRQIADPAFRPLLQVTTRDLGGEVEIRVRDNGTGIAPEIRDKLFQPFVTTKPTGEGTGLGLSISYDIVTQQHGGTIAVESEIGQFTEFTIRLPRTASNRSSSFPLNHALPAADNS